MAIYVGAKDGFSIARFSPTALHRKGKNAPELRTDGSSVEKLGPV